jgi:hypothetical protein
VPLENAAIEALNGTSKERSQSGVLLANVEVEVLKGTSVERSRLCGPYGGDGAQGASYGSSRLHEPVGNELVFVGEMELELEEECQ